MEKNPARTLGEIINVVYERLLAEYGDAELAAVATAAVVNDLLTAPPSRASVSEEAA